MRLIFLFFTSWLCSSQLTATTQSSFANARNWQVLKTGRFVLYTPKEYDTWARYILQMLPDIDQRVKNIVGKVNAAKINIYMDDRFPLHNGATIGTEPPKIILFPYPPRPSRSMAVFSDWTHRILTHEMVHIHHLTGKEPNLDLPRWIAEGYATLLEGMISDGRPDDPMLHSQLLEWAAAGKLPSYAEIETESDLYDDLMIYHLGYAFLHYIQKNHSEKLLPHIWQLMLKKNLSWEEAFAIATGKEVNDSYDNWRVKLTIKSYILKKSVGKNQNSLKIWQNFSYPITKIAIDSTQKKMAILANEDNGRIDFFKLDANREQYKKWTKKYGKEQSKENKFKYENPLPEFLPRKPFYSWQLHTSISLRNFSWLNRDSIILETFTPRSISKQDPILSQFHRLDIKKKASSQLNPEIRGLYQTSKGHILIATYLEKARSNIGIFTEGKISPIIKGDFKNLFGDLQFHPTENRIAYQVHRGNGWKIEELSLDSKQIRKIPTAKEFRDISGFTYSADGSSIYFTAASQGVTRLVQIALTDYKQTLMFQGLGQFISPTATQDHVYLLEKSDLESTIWKIGTKHKPIMAYKAENIFPITKKSNFNFKHQKIDQATYGLSHQYFSYSGNFGVFPSNDFAEIGFRGGEYFDRFKWLAVSGNLGNRGKLELKYAGFSIFAEGYSFFQNPERQHHTFTKTTTDFNYEGSGNANGFKWKMNSRHLGLDLEVSKWIYKYTIPIGAPESKRTRSGGRFYFNLPIFHFISQGGSIAYNQIKEESWSRQTANLNLDSSWKLGIVKVKISAKLTQGDMHGTILNRDLYRLGGAFSAASTPKITSQQIASPLLPLAHLSGEAFQRTEGIIHIGNAAFFWDRVRIGERNKTIKEWEDIEVRGIKYIWNLSAPWQPSFGGLRFTAGIGSALHRTRGYASITMID